MGKLFGSRAYLIGAMDRVKDHGAGWREDLTPELHKLGVMVFNPLKKPTEEMSAMEDPISRDRRKQWKLDGEYDKFSSVKKIRSIDLNMTDKSDFIVANIDVEVHACGTYEELFWANRCKKPILIHCEQGKEHCPDWLFWTVPHCHIFSDWQSLLGHLDKINNGFEDSTNRWVFFNMEKEIEAINRYRGLSTSACT